MPRFVAVPAVAKAIAANGPFDAVVLVAHAPLAAAAALPALKAPLSALARADSKHASTVNLVAAPELAGGRLVVAPVAALAPDHQDVRAFGDAAAAGVRRARDAGATAILLLVQAPPPDARYAHAALVTALAADDALWSPPQAREHSGERAAEPVRTLGVAVLGEPAVAPAPRWLDGVAAGLRLARDLTSGDPEHLAPPRFATAVQRAFRGTSVKVTVTRDVRSLQRDYPLLAAVAGGAAPGARHRPCVVRLEYRPKGKVARTLLFAGKGVTYDTGGADLKVGGHMVGMSDDKGGAAAVAGLFLAASGLGLRGVRLVAELGVVRNSIGSDAFVSDEILVSHAGCRVRIGNTDAEGRLVLADLLSHLRVEAAAAEQPQLVSVATLTGHAARAVGGYTVALDNGPARAAGTAASLARAGDLLGDPVEVSRLRREDYAFVRGRSAAEDVLQCNSQPSSATPRGHQFPMAFLALASGLDKHGADSALPLPFTHVDIAGSAVTGPAGEVGRPTGRPVVALLAALCGALPPTASADTRATAPARRGRRRVTAR
jgi:leucyl aminopeptidase